MGLKELIFKKEPKMVKVGIADCNGIESYVDEKTLTKSTLYGLQLRAQANRQRCALVYKAEVSEALDAKVKEALADKKFETALRLIKAGAQVKLEDSPAAAEHWKLIPNAKLDAFF